MKITQEERDAVYKTIYARRDVRREFKPDPISDEVINRVLTAAHHAPSVGFMQPWDFILVQSTENKEKIKAGFEFAHSESKKMFDGEKADRYQQLKLEGILESPLGICVTCDRNRNGPVVLGKTINEEMDLYSSVCAVQNLWLAARAENLGVGWVSIIHNSVLRDVLNIPEEIEIIAYLCIGYVTQFNDKPDLEKAGWLPRRDVKSAIHYENWAK